MSAQKRGLGRGLNALLGDAGVAPTPTRPTAHSAGTDTADVVRDLSIERIAPNPAQPRKHFDQASLAELAESIAQYGVLVPIIVRARGDRFEIVAGERRWRASALAKRSSIPAIVRQSDDSDAIEVAIVENLQREDLNPLEEAAGYAHLIEEHGFTQEQLAKRLGKSRPAIANAMRLLSLDDEIKKMLVEGVISAGHARALLAMTHEARGPLARRIVAEGLSVRSIEELVRAESTPTQANPRANKRADHLSAEERDFVERMRERFGTSVALVHSGNGGRIELRFADDSELLRIGDLLLGA